jgi:lipopolysaccharide export system ATP-binding protein
MMILELLPYSPRERKDLGRRYLDELGLLSLASQQAHSLSGGERRRLEICRALALKPAFLLLDEPFTGIDPLTIRDLQKIFLRLKEQGISLILSDHNIHDTLKIADRALIMDNGEVLIEGSPPEVAADKRARERFLGNKFKIEDCGPAIVSS